MKRHLEDQESIESAYPKSKRCKLEFQQNLIREILSPKACYRTVKNAFRKSLSSEQIIMREEFLITNSQLRDAVTTTTNPTTIQNTPKLLPSSKNAERKHYSKFNPLFPKPLKAQGVTTTMKPTTCVKCSSKFFECSFTLCEAEGLQDCCRQTIRSYLLQRRLGPARITNYY